KRDERCAVELAPAAGLVPVCRATDTELMAATDWAIDARRELPRSAVDRIWWGAPHPAHLDHGPHRPRRRGPAWRCTAMVIASGWRRPGWCRSTTGSTCNRTAMPAAAAT